MKTPRRATLHALSEICTERPLVFEANGTELSEHAIRLLGALAKLLESKPWLNISVEAHSDSTEAAVADAAAALSLARAMAVVVQLESLGVERKRLTPHGFGNAFPCDDGATDAGRARNRRVEFIVIPDQQSLKAAAAATAADEKSGAAMSALAALIEREAQRERASLV